MVKQVYENMTRLEKQAAVPYRRPLRTLRRAPHCSWSLTPALSHPMGEGPGRIALFIAPTAMPSLARSERERVPGGRVRVPAASLIPALSHPAGLLPDSFRGL